jgi:Fe2+ transport system protein FeoA
MFKMQEEVEKDNTVRLPDVPVGASARVRSLPRNPVLSTRLRELGIYEDTLLRLLGDSYGSVVLEVNQSRFGLSKHAARSVLVSFDK